MRQCAVGARVAGPRRLTASAPHPRRPPGTIGAKLAEALGLEHFSTGDLFRYNVKNKTLLGQEATKYMNAGELVPDEVTRLLRAVLLIVRWPCTPRLPDGG